MNGVGTDCGEPGENVIYSDDNIVTFDLNFSIQGEK